MPADPGDGRVTNRGRELGQRTPLPRTIEHQQVLWNTPAASFHPRESRRREYYFARIRGFEMSGKRPTPDRRMSQSRSDQLQWAVLRGCFGVTQFESMAPATV